MTQEVQESSGNSLFSDFRLSLVNKDNLRAIASCKVGGAVYLSGMRVVSGSKGLFVAMPSRKDKKGEYRDIFFPASRAVRDGLQQAILSKYAQVVSAVPH